MNKFVLGALALTASSAPTLAGTGTEEWTKLDKDIESLASSLAPQSSGASVNGFVKTSYAGSGDVTIPYDTNGNGTISAGEGNDLGGFSVDIVRLNFAGTVGNFGLFIALDGAQETSVSGTMLPSHLNGGTGNAGGVNVLDAYATFKITNELSGQVGEFRPPFLGESLHSEDQLLFMDRSAIGDFWAFRDNGAMLAGQFGQISAWLAGMNGDDSAGDELALAARVQFVAMGAAPTVEGAYGATGQNNLIVGAGYYDDGALSDGTAFCFDAMFNAGAFSAMAGMVDHDQDIGFALPANSVTVSSNTADASPWMIAGGFMFVPNQWEAGVRYEDFDDDEDTTAITLGVNWYQAGHAAKVQFNYSMVDSDANANEIDMYQIGLVASI